MEKWQSRLNYIRELGDIPTTNPYEEESPILDLGTIGGGNHFAEFQKVEQIFEKEDSTAFDEDSVFLLVHSGSRAYGQQILNQFKSETGYSANSEDAQEYLKWHNHAVLWAERNRKIVADKLIDWLGFSSEAKALIDCKHNYIEKIRPIIREMSLTTTL